jgi:hypothetical protein
LPPQATFTGGTLVVELPPAALLWLPHAERISTPVTRMLSAAPNRLSFNRIPSDGQRSWSHRRFALTAVSLASMRHGNKIRTSVIMPRARAIRVRLTISAPVSRPFTIPTRCSGVRVCSTKNRPVPAARRRGEPTHDGPVRGIPQRVLGGPTRSAIHADSGGPRRSVAADAKRPGGDRGSPRAGNVHALLTRASDVADPARISWNTSGRRRVIAEVMCVACHE